MTVEVLHGAQRMSAEYLHCNVCFWSKLPLMSRITLQGSERRQQVTHHLKISFGPRLLGDASQARLPLDVWIARQPQIEVIAPPIAVAPS